MVSTVFSERFSLALLAAVWRQLSGVIALSAFATSNSIERPPHKCPTD
jgi:hypothetical protein